MGEEINPRPLVYTQRPEERNREEPARGARYYDHHGIGHCMVCMNEVLFLVGEHTTSGMCRDDALTRWYEWKERPSDEDLALFEDVLANDGCRLDLHRRYEQRALAQALQAVEAAGKAADHLRWAPEGWSIPLERVVRNPSPCVPRVSDDELRA